MYINLYDIVYLAVCSIFYKKKFFFVILLINKLEISWLYLSPIEKDDYGVCCICKATFMYVADLPHFLYLYKCYDFLYLREGVGTRGRLG